MEMVVLTERSELEENTKIWVWIIFYGLCTWGNITCDTDYYT